MKRDNKPHAFNPAFIEELLSEFNIVEFIKEFVPLTPKGDNFVARCPFHTENTPSFVVSDKKGIFRCFGCGKGGNLIKFLMEKEGMTYYESILYLSEKCGKEMPAEFQTEEYKKYKEIQQALSDINKLTLDKWLENFKSSKVAPEYLVERGIDLATAETFSVCLAADDWNQIKDLLTSNSFSLETCVTSGLVLESKGKHYDRFRNRIITPIFDVHGKLIAFSGRTLSSKKAEVKYINSPDTPLYNKGKHLYGLNVTKDDIKAKGFAVVTEGNFDIISLYQNGVTNAVAALGTSLTPQQAKLLKRYTQRVVLCYDGDSAGAIAAERAIKVLQKEGFIIKVMELPKGLDPDTYIRKVGRKEFNEQRGKAVSWFKYLVEQSAKKHDLSNPTDKAKLLEKVKDIVNYSSTDLEKKEYFEQAMNMLKIDKTVAQAVWKSVPTGSPVVAEIRIKEEATLVESRLLQLMIIAKDRKIVLDEVKQYLQNPSVRTIALILGNMKDEFKYNLIESLLKDEEDKEFLCKLILDVEETKPKDEHLEKDIQNCISSIKQNALMVQMEEVGQLLKEHNEKVSDTWESELNSIIERQMNLYKELRTLRLTYPQS